MSTAPPTAACCLQLIEDHRATEALMVELGTLINTGKDWPAAQAVFNRLCHELDCHFVVEEHGLFPVLNQYRPMMLMEIEHDDLLSTRKQLADVLNKAHLQNEPIDAVSQAWRQFSERLQAHIIEEDRGIFPMAQQLLEPEEQALVKRKMAEIAEKLKDDAQAGTLLNRPTPHAQVATTALFTEAQRPIAYHQLFHHEHVKVQHIQLRAGQTLSPHWAPEIQTLIVLAGEVELQTSDPTLPPCLTPGQQLTVEPRFYFGLKAIQESELLAIRVWPRPYFIRG